jgi:hypothetical protein
VIKLPLNQQTRLKSVHEHKIVLADSRVTVSVKARKNESAATGSAWEEKIR